MRDFRERKAEGEAGRDIEPDHNSFRFTLDEIKSVVEMVRGSDVSEFKLERGEDKIWVKRGQDAPVQAPTYQPQYMLPPLSQEPQAFRPNIPNIFANSIPANSSGFEAPMVGGGSVASAAGTYEVKSPMVGTFYRKPAPDAPSFVDVGSVIKKGDVLCIVEAMKLMNEIESEISGRVVEVCLPDGQMVEYGEVLFRVEQSS